MISDGWMEARLQDPETMSCLVWETHCFCFSVPLDSWYLTSVYLNLKNVKIAPKHAAQMASWKLDSAPTWGKNNSVAAGGGKL